MFVLEDVPKGGTVWEFRETDKLVGIVIYSFSISSSNLQTLTRPQIEEKFPEKEKREWFRHYCYQIGSCDLS